MEGDILISEYWNSLVGKLTIRDHLKDIVVIGMIILKLILREIG
jgi:hypothetical protein